MSKKLTKYITLDEFIADLKRIIICNKLGASVRIDVRLTEMHSFDMQVRCSKKVNKVKPISSLE
jgi:hypothetical protein